MSSRFTPPNEGVISLTVSMIFSVSSPNSFLVLDGGHEEARGQQGGEAADAGGSRGEPEAREPTEGTVCEVSPVLSGQDRDRASGAGAELLRCGARAHAGRRGTQRRSRGSHEH